MLCLPIEHCAPNGRPLSGFAGKLAGRKVTSRLFKIADELNTALYVWGKGKNRASSMVCLLDIKENSGPFVDMKCL